MNLPLLAALLIPLLRRGVSAVDELERALAREDRLLPIFILSSISVRTWVNRLSPHFRQIAMTADQKSRHFPANKKRKRFAALLSNDGLIRLPAAHQPA
jgi:hypothetical protein